jgi:autotransporter-associated beta strand protein
MKGNWERILAVLVLAAVVAAALPVKPVQAAACTFTSAATGSWSAAGTWTRTGTSCSSTYPGQGIAGDTVVMANSFTVTLDVSPAYSIASLTFPSGNNADTTVNLSGYTLNVSGAVTIPRAGSSGTTPKNTLAVGTSTLNAGTIAFTSGGSSSRHQLTISTGTVTVTDVTTDDPGASASLVFTGAGLLRVSGQLMSSGTVGGTLTTVAGSTVEYNGAAQTARVDTYNGNLTLSGSGAKTFATTPTVNGMLSMEGTATVVVTTGVVTYGANATLQYNTSTARTASSEEWITTFNGSGGVIIANTGAITLNGAKTLNQPLTVKAGATLNLSTFTLGAPTSLTMEGGATTGASIIGSGTLTLGGNVTVDDAGTGTSGATISAPVALGATRTFTVADDGTSAADLTISGIISGATFGVTKAGAGTMVFSGVNTYIGVTTINTGVLSVATIGNGGVAGDLGQATNVIGNLVLGGGTLQYTGATASTDRGFTLTAGTTSSIDVTNSGTTLTMSGSSATTTGALTKIGAGTLVFSGAKSYTGLTTVSAGTLRYGVTNALSSGGVTADNGSTFDIVSYNDTVGAVTLIDGTIAGTTGVLTGASYDVRNGTVSAILGGTGVALTKTTAGTVILSGANTYTGATTVSAGILDVKTNTGLGTTAGTTSVTSGAVIQIDGSGLNIAEPITLNGDGISSGGALRNLANSNTWSGAITLTSASRINSDAGTLTLTGGVTGGFGLTIGGSGNTTVSTAAIGTGAGTVTKDGSGTLTMNVANTYTGGTTLNAGTLNINNAQALGTVAGTSTINGGAIDNTSVADITTLNYPLALNGDFAYSGSVPRNLNLGTGTVTMNADREITVSAGTLTIGGTISAGTRTLTKAGAGTLSFGANAVTLNGLMISTGTLTSTSGTMSLAGDFTNNGTFTPNGGTVNFNGTTQTGSGAGTLNFYNLTIASGTTTFSRASTVGGALSISSGAVLEMGAYKVTGGTFTYGGPGTLSNNETKSVTLAGGTQTFLDGRTASSAQLTVVGGSNPGSTIVTTTIGTTIPASWKGTCSAQPAAVKRYYNITAGTNTGLDVTLRLYYDDLELNGIAENSVSIYHCENGTWVWEPGIYSRDTTANWVQVTGVDSFSPFILSKGDPTSAELLSFRALGLENSINLRWEMASGANNLGFNVYRAAKVDGARTQVNEDLILSQVPPGGSDRASYQYTDITPELKAGGVYFYWLEMVDISGATRLYGPVELRLAK